MKLRWLWLLPLVAAGGALFAGCGDPAPPNPTAATFFTPAEAAEQVQAIKNDAVSIANGLLDGVLNEAIVGFPVDLAPAGTPHAFLAETPGVILLMQVPGEASPRVATGTFAFNEGWTYTSSPSTHLVVRWTADGVAAAPVMELIVTGSDPELVTLPDGRIVSAPRRTVWNLRRNGTVVVDVTLDQAWRQTACGLLGEARSLSMAGTAGNSAAGITFRDLNVSSPVDGRWLVDGGIDFRSGSLTLALDPDLDVRMAVTRNATTCLIEAVDDVDVEIDVKLTSATRLARLMFGGAGSAATGGISAEIWAGRFIVGSKKVEFAGTWNDGGDPAAAVLLTFAVQEASTLAQFVERFGLLD